MDLDIQDNEGVIRVTTGDSRKGVIFVFSVCIHVCIFGGDEIECYLSIQGMYCYIQIILKDDNNTKESFHKVPSLSSLLLLSLLLSLQDETTITCCNNGKTNSQLCLCNIYIINSSFHIFYNMPLQLI